MKPCLILTFLMLFVVCRIPVSIAQTPEEIAKKSLDAAVLLVMVDANGEVSSGGSGFFVQPNRIVTNFHVIDGSAGGTVRLVGQETVYPVERIFVVDKKHDLAILQVLAPGVEPLPIGDSEFVEVGEQIYVLGNPLGVLEGTFSDGIISGIREVDGVELFQVTAPISEGNSGGAVLNAKGEVIGVSQGVVPAGQNLNFAIPSIYLKRLVNQLGQEMLEIGIEQYEETRFTEAIKSLRSALRGLTDPKQRALAHIYLGCSKRGAGDSDHSVSAEFKEALRHNPDQTLPARIGNDHPIFKLLLEKVRSESTGRLTVTCSLPQAEIWIDGNEIDKRMIGIGTYSVRLFVGDYSAEGVYGGVSRKQTVNIEPDEHEKLYLELPPIVKHKPPSRVSVGEIIPLALNSISREKPKLVQIHYITYDRNGDESKRGLQEMLVSNEQPKPTTWIYRSELPSQKHVGKIAYFITADETRSPKSQYHEISIIDENRPEIDVLEPQEAAEFQIDQPIMVRARVTDNTTVDDVRVHYAFSKFGGSKPSEESPSQPLEWEVSTDTFVGHILIEQNAAGYIWYYLTATDEGRNEGQSDVKRIEIVTPGKRRSKGRLDDKDEKGTESRLYQGIWVSHGWSQDVLDHRRFVSRWDRGNVLGFSYLTEGKGYRTLGIQLDYSYQIPDNINATVQWGPPMRTGAIAFTFLGGLARYRSPNSDLFGESHGARSTLDDSTQMTPFLGASLKLYPLDTVTFDFTGSIKLRSVDTNSSGESTSIAKHLQHYEMGARVYISPTLNLKVGFGKWYLEDRGNSTVQVGLGVTF